MPEHTIILFKDSDETITLCRGSKNFALSVLEKGKPIHTFPVPREIAIELGVWLIKELQ